MSGQRFLVSISTNPAYFLLQHCFSFNYRGVVFVVQLLDNFKIRALFADILNTLSLVLYALRPRKIKKSVGFRCGPFKSFVYGFNLVFVQKLIWLLRHSHFSVFCKVFANSFHHMTLLLYHKEL